MSSRTVGSFDDLEPIALATLVSDLIEAASGMTSPYVSFTQSSLSDEILVLVGEAHRTEQPDPARIIFRDEVRDARQAVARRRFRPRIDSFDIDEGGWSPW